VIHHYQTEIEHNGQHEELLLVTLNVNTKESGMDKQSDSTTDWQGNGGFHQQHWVEHAILF